MNFYGASSYQDPTLAALNAKTNAMMNNINGYSNAAPLNPALFTPQNAANMQVPQFGSFGSYGQNPLMPGTSLLNQNQTLSFGAQPNMYGQPGMLSEERSCDIGKATRGFTKGVILNPLKNMFGTPTKAAMTLGTMGVAAAACACPLTAPVAIPVCAGLALWSGIQGAIKFVTGAGKAVEAAGKGDGQEFEKAFEDVGEGTFNLVGAYMAKKGFEKTTGKGPLDILKGTWDDGVNAVKGIKMPKPEVSWNPKNWFKSNAEPAPVQTNTTPTPNAASVASETPAPVNTNTASVVSETPAPVNTNTASVASETATPVNTNTASVASETPTPTNTAATAKSTTSVETPATPEATPPATPKVEAPAAKAVNANPAAKQQLGEIKAEMAEIRTTRSNLLQEIKNNKNLTKDQIVSYRNQLNAYKNRYENLAAKQNEVLQQIPQELAPPSGTLQNIISKAPNPVKNTINRAIEFVNAKKQQFNAPKSEAPVNNNAEIANQFNDPKYAPQEPVNQNGAIMNKNGEVLAGGNNSVNTTSELPVNQGGQQNAVIMDKNGEVLAGGPRTNDKTLLTGNFNKDFGTYFNINKNNQIGMYTDPSAAHKQMLEEVKAQVAAGAISPAQLPPELQQQIGALYGQQEQFKQLS
ncbi:MAG: hypothetical protein WCK67_11205 [bacterium]